MACAHKLIARRRLALKKRKELRPLPATPRSSYRQNRLLAQQSLAKETRDAAQKHAGARAPTTPMRPLVRIDNDEPEKLAVDCTTLLKRNRIGGVSFLADNCVPKLEMYRSAMTRAAEVVGEQEPFVAEVRAALADGLVLQSEVEIDMWSSWDSDSEWDLAAKWGASVPSMKKQWALQTVKETGAFNSVSMPSNPALLHATFPQQLLPHADQLVFRVTKPGQGRDPAAAAEEAAVSIAAASMGIAPRVYAVCICGAHSDVMVMALERYEMSLHEWMCDMASTKRAAEAREMGEVAGAKVSGLLAAVSGTGLFLSDIKPANVLVRQEVGELPSFALCDFDSMFTKHTAERATSLFLANLLLLCAHVRAFANEAFYEGFREATRGLLLELCREAGRGGLIAARLATTKERGRFSGARLALKTAAGDEAGLLQYLFASLVFEYFFATGKQVSPPRAAVQHNWPKASWGAPFLVPALLGFFLSGTEGPEWARFLDVRREPG